jgi:hypothetical protein
LGKFLGKKDIIGEKVVNYLHFIPLAKFLLQNTINVSFCQDFLFPRPPHLYLFPRVRRGRGEDEEKMRRRQGGKVGFLLNLTLFDFVKQGFVADA